MKKQSNRFLGREGALRSASGEVEFSKGGMRGRALERWVPRSRLSRLSHGGYSKFSSGSARELADLLRAVATFAVGGVTALADLRTDGARKLLGQLK